MIIGGAYQGKTEYAKKEYPDLIWGEGSSLSREELFAAEGVLNFHEFIRREIKAGREVSDLAEALIRKNPKVVLVSQEVGYAFDRKYREAVGRVCTRLAAYSHKVTRVACGIGMVIKND